MEQGYYVAHYCLLPQGTSRCLLVRGSKSFGTCLLCRSSAWCSALACLLPVPWGVCLKSVACHMFSCLLPKRSEQTNVLFWYGLVLHFWAEGSVLLLKSFYLKQCSHETERALLTSLELGASLLCSWEITEYLSFLYSLPAFISITENKTSFVVSVLILEFRAVEKQNGFSEFVPLWLCVSKYWCYTHSSFSFLVVWNLAKNFF